MDTNICCGTTSVQTVSTDLYWPIHGYAIGSSSTPAPNYTVMPIAGVLKNFYVQCQAGPGVGLSRTYTVAVNGVDTALTITVTGTGTGVGVSSNADTIHRINIAVGDQVSIHSTATGTTTDAGRTMFGLDFAAPANTSFIAACSRSQNLSTTLTSFLPIQGAGFDTTAGTNELCVFPTTGTLKNAAFNVNNAPGVGNSYTATLIQNGSPTSIVIVASGAASGTFYDNTHSVAVAAGDTFYWSIAVSGAAGATAGILSMEFDPTINGESVHMYASNVVTTNSAARFQSVVSPNAASYQSGETARQVASQAAVWKKLFVVQQTAPGGSASYQYQVSVAATPGNPSVTISAAATTGSDTTNSVQANAQDTVIIKITPTTTPATTIVAWGLVSFIQPAKAGFLELMQ